MESSEKLLFADLELDFARRELQRGGQTVPVRATPLRLLLYLADHRDRPVSRRDLLDHVWGAQVTDAAVSNAIKEVREAVGDTKKAQHVIKTVPGGGYQFVADCQKVAGASFDERPSIAVLPFANQTGDPADAHLALGISHGVILELSYWCFYPVIDAGSSLSSPGVAINAARKLGARWVVVGSVQRSSERVRVEARLLDVETSRAEWGDIYSRTIDDVFSLQRELAQQVVAALYPAILFRGGERASRRAPSSLQAWELAARGWWHWHRPSPASNVEARRMFELALQGDATFSWAVFGLAMTRLYDVLYQTADSRPGALADMRELAARCVQIDANDAMGPLVLGIATCAAGRLADGITSLRRSLELNPSLSLAYRWLGLALALSDQTEEALASLRIGMRLSPRDPLIWSSWSNISIAHFIADDLEQAIAAAKESLARNPDWLLSHGLLATSYGLLDRKDDAKAALREVRRLLPGFTREGFRPLLELVIPDYAERILEGLRLAGQLD